MKAKYFIKEEWGWRHNTPLKQLINPILRLIQWRTNRPWVIASVCEFENNKPIFIKYKLARIRCFKSVDELESFRKK